jgi:hypothetical protein
MIATASCTCEQLRLTVDGEPLRLSLCHCLSCKRRTGSAFGIQARFQEEDVRLEGEHRDYVRVSEKGIARTFSFCPNCGNTVFWKSEDAPDIVAVPVGAFADPDFPAPTVTVWEKRRSPWLDLPGVPVEARHHEDD